MKMIYMGRKKQSVKLLDWTLAQGIEIVAVCTDSQFENSPTAQYAREANIPIISMEEAEEYVNSHPGEIDLVVSYLYWRRRVCFLPKLKIRNLLRRQRNKRYCFCFLPLRQIHQITSDNATATTRQEVMIV